MMWLVSKVVSDLWHRIGIKGELYLSWMQFQEVQEGIKEWEKKIKHHQTVDPTQEHSRLSGNRMVSVYQFLTKKF